MTTVRTQDGPMLFDAVKVENQTRIANVPPLKGCVFVSLIYAGWCFFFLLLCLICLADIKNTLGKRKFSKACTLPRKFWGP